MKTEFSFMKEGVYYQKTQHEDRDYTIVLSQMRLLDRKRFRRKIRVLPETEFEEVRKRFKNLLP